MTSCCECDDTELHTRARPLLGTVVEITALAKYEVAMDAINGAFDTVAAVQQLMSYHDPASEIARLNSFACRFPQAVSEQTLTVLRAALEFSASSDGAFDIVVSGSLGQATWRDLEIKNDGRIFFRCPLNVDLGGIAKGYAADQAVRKLKQAGIEAGLVNAGGDIAAYGERRWDIYLRRPGTGVPSSHVLSLRNAAIATSAYYSPYYRTTANHVGQGRLSASAQDRSFSVCAGNAMIADALTKVVMMKEQAAESILRKYEAGALVLDSQEVLCMFP